MNIHYAIKYLEREKKYRYYRIQDWLGPPFNKKEDRWREMKYVNRVFKINECLYILHNNKAAIKAYSYQANFTIFFVAKNMKASSKITVVLGDCKEKYNNALENLHRAMKAIPPHDLSTVTVMLSVVMVGDSVCDNGFKEHKVSITANIYLSIASLIPYQEGFALLGRVDFLLGFNKNPKDYANRSTIQWHRVSVYPQKLRDLVTEHVVPTLRFIYYHR